MVDRLARSNRSRPLWLRQTLVRIPRANLQTEPRAVASSSQRWRLVLAWIGMAAPLLSACGSPKDDGCYYRDSPGAQRAHLQTIGKLLVSEEGALLVSIAPNDSRKSWSLPDVKLLQTDTHVGGWGTDETDLLSTDGRLLGNIMYCRLSIAELPDGPMEEIASFDQRSCSFSDSLGRFLTDDGAGNVQVYQTSPTSLVSSFYVGQARCSIFCEDEKSLVCGEQTSLATTSPTRLSLWSIDSGAMVSSVDLDYDLLHSSASGGARQAPGVLALGGTILRLPSLEVIRQIPGDILVGLSADGLLAVVKSGTSISFIDINTGATVLAIDDTYEHSTAFGPMLAFSGTSQHAFFATTVGWEDRDFRVWSILEGTLLGVPSDPAAVDRRCYKEGCADCIYACRSTMKRKALAPPGLPAYDFTDTRNSLSPPKNADMGGGG